MQSCDSTSTLNCFFDFEADPTEKDSLRYISELLNYEGAESLLQKLKKLQLATGILCDSNDTYLITYFRFFTIQIELTSYGVEEYQKVIEIVFAYIRAMA